MERRSEPLTLHLSISSTLHFPLLLLYLFTSLLFYSSRGHECWVSSLLLTASWLPSW
jgi:hypothetical protein